MAKVKVDWRGVEEAAKLPGVHAAVDAAAEEVGDNVRSLGIRVAGDKIELPVKVHTGATTTNMRMNRALASVVLAHAAGLAVQAKHGALSKAASAAGLRVTGD